MGQASSQRFNEGVILAGWTAGWLKILWMTLKPFTKEMLQKMQLDLYARSPSWTLADGKEKATMLSRSTRDSDLQLPSTRSRNGRSLEYGSYYEWDDGIGILYPHSEGNRRRRTHGKVQDCGSVAYTSVSNYKESCKKAQGLLSEMVSELPCLTACQISAPSCGTCNLSLARPFACLHCSFIGCWSPGHIQAHLQNTGHAFGKSSVWHSVL